MTAAPVAAVPRGGRFPALDGLRGLAAVAVVTTHVGFSSGAALNGPFNAVLARLDVSVAIFFVVSGFLLYRPHVSAHLDGRPSERWSSYLRNRALRILPAYWVALLLAALIVPQSREAGADTWLLHVLLLQIYDGETQITGLAQMWSLSTEISFYLLLPVMVIALLRGGPGSTVGRGFVARHAVLALLMVLGVVWTAMVSTPEANLWLPGLIGWFAGGMGLAWWREMRLRGNIRPTLLDDLARLPAYCFTAAALVYLLACTALAGPYDLSEPTPFQAAMKNALFLVIAMLLVLPATVVTSSDNLPDTSTRFLASRPLRWLGDVSYGFFCYHMAILFAMERLIGHEHFTGHFWLLWPLTVSLGLLAADTSYRWLERPVMRWGRRGARPTAGAATTDTPVSAKT